ncbi:MAG: PTS sugar transporter subunit IIA [Treponema sp.]|nr:PTS sugar transporter subunit IIA [Treponema sp.]
MFSSEDLCALIEKAGVYSIEGSSVSDLLSSAVSKMALPSGLDPQVLLDELMAREKILSTAVGNGIALPHPLKKVIDNPADQRIAVCYLKEPIDMQAPDSRKVYVFFILLTAASQKHLDILSAIANLAKDKDFKSLLETCPDEVHLLEAIRKCGA